MLSNYFKIAFRSLRKNRVYSVINIGGLAIGMAVALLIGLWVYDEFSYDRYHQNYDRIAQIGQHGTTNGVTWTGNSLPYPLANELRTKYGNYFKHVLIAWPIQEHILTAGDENFSRTGEFIEAGAPEMLSLNMLEGSWAGLADPHSILLSASTAKTLFGDADPMGKVMKINNAMDVKVTGVYEDLPRNTQFHEVKFFAPWDLFVSANDWIKKYTENNWGNNYLKTFVELAPLVDADRVSAIIKNIKHDKLTNAELIAMKQQIFLHPMRKWHLYSEWDKQGVNTGGRIQFVWLFGIIGGFVLLLACINFMTLATARSEKRAKEVGIRKTFGSVRGQLITQFFSESLLVVAFAFILSVLLVQLVLPFFNEVADKEMSFPWLNPVFWLLGIGFSLLTGLVAGSYPALYLSSFQPVKVLKGTLRAGRYASVPRRVLVVAQFAVSVTLIIGTIIVYRQIQHAKNRPVGYTREGLLQIQISSSDFNGKYELLRDELKKTGAVLEVAESASRATEMWSSNGGFDWKGKDPSLQPEFGTLAVTQEYGKTVGWQFVAGRDFSRDFSTDSAGFVINEAAARFMGMKNPVGETLKRDGKPYRILGVVKDMVMESPFEPAFQTVFFLGGPLNWINIKINPSVSSGEALPKIEAVFKQLFPSIPFDYKFVDQQYALKFAAEERIGILAGFFAILAILISCLGIFGLASFTAEQRTKEIGIRKVLGATVLDLWALLSKDFVRLVLISFLVAMPLAWYFMNGWLQKYAYRTDISWWVFALAGLGALFITILTVSYQAIKAALANPVKSLRTE